MRETFIFAYKSCLVRPQNVRIFSPLPFTMHTQIREPGHVIRFTEACRDILGFVTNPIQNTTLFARRQLAGGLERGNSVAGGPQHHP